MPTGLIASKLGFVKFLVPYVFIYNTALLILGPLISVIWSFLTAVAGTVVISMGLEGYLFAHVPKWRRPLYLVAGAFCLIPEIYSFNCKDDGAFSSP